MWYRSIFRSNAKKGFDCTGLELNRSAVEVCRQKGLNVSKQLLEEHVTEHAEMYDVVCSFGIRTCI